MQNFITLKLEERKLVAGQLRTAKTLAKKTPLTTKNFYKKTIASLSESLKALDLETSSLLANNDTVLTSLAALNWNDPLFEKSNRSVIYAWLPELKDRDQERRKKELREQFPIVKKDSNYYTTKALAYVKKTYPDNPVNIQDFYFLDCITPFYSRGHCGALYQLSAAQLKVFHHLCEELLSDSNSPEESAKRTINTATIAEKANMDSKLTSAHLTFLENKGFVTVDRSKPRKYYYGIDDPCFLAWANVAMFNNTRWVAQKSGTPTRP